MEASPPIESQGPRGAVQGETAVEETRGAAEKESKREGMQKEPMKRMEENEDAKLSETGSLKEWRGQRRRLKERRGQRKKAVGRKERLGQEAMLSDASAMLYNAPGLPALSLFAAFAKMHSCISAGQQRERVCMRAWAAMVAVHAYTFCKRALLPVCTRCIGRRRVCGLCGFVCLDVLSCAFLTNTYTRVEYSKRGMHSCFIVCRRM